MSSSFHDQKDEQLAAIVASNHDAYDVLMERYEEKLMRYIRRLSNVSQQDAEDILQDVFLKAFQHIHDFDTSLSFSSWIYRITHNAVISEYRRWSKRQCEPIESDEECFIQIADGIDLEASFDTKLLRENMRNALQTLPESERDALMLHYMEGLSIQEISDVLRRPLGSIATLMRRGKERLRDFFQRHFPSSS